MKKPRISYKERAQAMYEALVNIRAKAYQTKHEDAPAGILRILQFAEFAIAEAEAPAYPDYRPEAPSTPLHDKKPIVCMHGISELVPCVECEKEIAAHNARILSREAL